MKLVLCIDRDNDLGRKTGVKSPIVGREENLKAAQALALADPEDSDVNCMFSAISIYDGLEDAEIATICGDVNVGHVSDTKLAQQLDEIIEKIKPDSVILVTDGAEDEHILPLVESRIKIDGIKRVIVRQSKTLEGTYYVLKKFMEDEKMQRKFMLPLAIVLLIWGFSVLFGSPSIGIAFILIVLGFYLIMRIIHVEKGISRFGMEIISGIKSGRMTIFSAVLAVFIMIIAVVSATKVLSQNEMETAEYVIKFTDQIIWWFIIAVLLIALGKFIDSYFKKRKLLWGYTILPFSLVAFGLILSASLNVLVEVIHEKSLHSIFTEYVLSIPFLTKIIGGILIAFIGTILYHIMEDIYKEENK